MPSPKPRNRYDPPSVLCCANGALLSLTNVQAGRPRVQPVELQRLRQVLDDRAAGLELHAAITEVAGDATGAEAGIEPWQPTTGASGKPGYAFAVGGVALDAHAGSGDNTSMKACAGIALVTVTLALAAQARKSYRLLRQAEETKRALAQLPPVITSRRRAIFPWLCLHKSTR